MTTLSTSLVGDGVTDDAPAIQAIIDAAEPNSVVRFDNGKTYALSQPVGAGRQQHNPRCTGAVRCQRNQPFSNKGPGAG
jgi:hypothetical protein